MYHICSCRAFNNISDVVKMRQQGIIVIIVAVILVALLGITATSMIMSDNNGTDNNTTNLTDNNTLNQTDNTTNTTTKTTTSKSSSSSKSSSNGVYYDEELNTLTVMIEQFMTVKYQREQARVILKEV